MPIPFPPEINPLNPERKTRVSNPPPSEKKSRSSWFLLPIPGIVALIPSFMTSRFNVITIFFLFLALLSCIFIAYLISKNSFNLKGSRLFFGVTGFTLLIAFINAAFSFPLGCCIALNRSL